MPKKKILLAGSIDKYNLKKIKNIYKLDELFELNGNCDFNTFDFDIEQFKKECNKGFDYILFIQCLNPRPVTLNEDLKTLSSIFPKDILRDRLLVLFVQKDVYKKDLNEIRNEIIEYFDVMFRNIGISGKNERISFAHNKIWLLESSDLLRGFFSKLFNDFKSTYYPNFKIKLNMTNQSNQQCDEIIRLNNNINNIDKKIVTISLPPKFKNDFQSNKNIGLKSIKKYSSSLNNLNKTTPIEKSQLISIYKTLKNNIGMFQ